MASFGAGSDAEYQPPITWPEKLTDIDAGSINTTELWTIKEKIDAGNCTISKNGSTSGKTFHVVMNSGDEYYIQEIFGSVYFVRRISGKKKKMHYNQFDFEFEE